MHCQLPLDFWGVELDTALSSDFFPLMENRFKARRGEKPTVTASKNRTDDNDDDRLNFRSSLS